MVYCHIAHWMQQLSTALLDMTPLELLGLWTCVPCYFLVCHVIYKVLLNISEMVWVLFNINELLVVVVVVVMHLSQSDLGEVWSMLLHSFFGVLYFVSVKIRMIFAKMFRTFID